jgi:hypothetical protein
VIADGQFTCEFGFALGAHRVRVEAGDGDPGYRGRAVRTSPLGDHEVRCDVRSSKSQRYIHSIAMSIEHDDRIGMCRRASWRPDEQARGGRREGDYEQHRDNDQGPLVQAAALDALHYDRVAEYDPLSAPVARRPAKPRPVE